MVTKHLDTSMAQEKPILSSSGKTRGQNSAKKKNLCFSYKE